MAGDPRVQQLLEEIFDSQRTPEEGCRDCPEFLPQVRLRWQHLRSIQARIDAFSPRRVPPRGGRGCDSSRTKNNARL